MIGGSNNEVHIVVRKSGERAGCFGRPGRNAGDFHWAHNIATDTQGGVYTAEVDTGKRTLTSMAQLLSAARDSAWGAPMPYEGLGAFAEGRAARDIAAGRAMLARLRSDA